MRFAFTELQQYRVEPVDWRSVMLELGAKGITTTIIADALTLPISTVNGWKNEGNVPRYESGAALLAMHARYCGPSS